MTSPSSDTGASTTRRNVLIGIAVVVIAVVAAVAWYLTRPEAATVDIDNALGGASTNPAPTATTEPAASASPTAEPAATEDTATDDAATPAGPQSEPATDTGSASDGSQAAAGETWTVSTDAVPYDFEAAEGTFVGFRIDEELSSVGSTTAVARTPAVNGELTLDDTTLATAMFTADLTELESDRGQRNGAIQRALNTSEEPEATFELTEPVDLGELPPVGEAIEVEAVGDLTVNGTTVSDTFPLQGGRTAEDQLVVTGSFDIALEDVGVEAPSAPIVVSVADTATVEFQLYLER